MELDENKGSEIWKHIWIDGVFTDYSISNYGNIRNIVTKRVLKCSENNGYLYITLTIKLLEKKRQTVSVSRLVAQHFIENNDKNKNVVNHIDGNTVNNHVSNLEWIDQKGNIKHAKESGLINFHSRQVLQYDLEGNFIKEYNSIEEGAKVINLTRDAICKVLKGKNKTAGGYFWKYKNPDISSLDGYEHSMIKEFPAYSVTKCGNVYSNKNKKMLKTMPNKKGYHYVTLMIDNEKKNKYVHRLVAEAFIENDDETKQYVNHKDKNKGNNCIDNLEWVTQSENMKHSYSS